MAPLAGRERPGERLVGIVADDIVKDLIGLSSDGIGQELGSATLERKKVRTARIDGGEGD